MFITFLIDGFTSGMKSQSMAYLLSGSEHIYWILDLEGEVHSIWVLWTRRPSKMQGQLFFEVGRGGQRFSVGFRKVFLGLPEGCGSRAPALILSGTPPPKNSLGRV